MGRPINTCPYDGLTFTYSTCFSEQIRAYSIYCQDPRIDASISSDVRVFLGECEPTEVCQHSESRWVAECVEASPEDQKPSQASPKRRRVQMNVDAIGSRPGGKVKAMLVSPGDNTEGVNATHMQIAAQSVNEIFGATSFTTITMAACDECGSVMLDPLPKGTTAINLVYDLGVASSASLYWLGS